jgi:phosphoribosyl 1,2-cyclic phosphate phosphodiesterase
MVFYGTSAAEGIPSPFCRCRVCEHARQVGGKEIRRRSMLRLSESACIDLGADAFQLAIEFGDFYQLKHVLVTHTHEDHFAHMMMNIRNMSVSPAPFPLHLYFTGEAFDIVDFYRNSKAIIKGLTGKLEDRGIVSFHKMEFGETYTVDDMDVTPYRGNHVGNMGEQSANYLLELPLGKRKLYYGLDTGWYLEETFKVLENAGIDILISECTMGLKNGLDPHGPGHLGAYNNMLLFEALLSQGSIRPDTAIYLTHINQSSTHQELVDYFAAQGDRVPNPITVAYDGLSIP